MSHDVAVLKGSLEKCWCRIESEGTQADKTVAAAHQLLLALGSDFDPLHQLVRGVKRPSGASAAGGPASWGDSPLSLVGDAASGGGEADDLAISRCRQTTFDDAV